MFRAILLKITNEEGANLKGDGCRRRSSVLWVFSAMHSGGGYVFELLAPGFCDRNMAWGYVELIQQLASFSYSFLQWKIFLYSVVTT